MSASRLRFARVKPVALLGGAVAALLLVTACGSSSTASETTAQAAASGSAAGSAAPAGTAADTLRLGYFPNVTHAAAVLGVANGTFQEALGNTKLETSTFNAGPAAIEALLSGAIDATFIGPNPAINSFVKSNGDSIRIVAGATDNGAALVVSPDINSAADLKGKTLATPQLGGTQDVALRKWLLDNGLKVQTTGG
ncbi:MAG TPA: ABC transporter substrate-binding protein, partial [Nakamurella multipartita]|nr:ABC transporter substrate-binding protein [Nakamurella multipartita]